MKKLFVFFIPFFFTFYSFSQSATDSIKQVINNMFSAMKDSDSAKLRLYFSETAFLQTFSRLQDGSVVVNNQSVGDFCKMVAGIPKGSADERIVYKDIKVDGAMASVWAPFKLYFNGTFYSCGVNSIQMSRLNGQWKIQYILDTRRKDDCAE